MASYGQRAARIKYAWSTSCIGFNSVFPRRHGSYWAKLTQIRYGWPGQGLAKCIWSGSKLVCRNHRAWFLAGRNWPATSFPLSDSVAFFHRHPRSYCAKPAQIRFTSGRQCQVWAKWIWSGSKPVCKSHLACFWPMLLSWSKSYPACLLGKYTLKPYLICTCHWQTRLKGLISCVPHFVQDVHSTKVSQSKPFNLHILLDCKPPPTLPSCFWWSSVHL